MWTSVRGALRLIEVIIAVGAAYFFVFESLAQSYPSKPVHMVVGFGAGGATDIAARVIAQKLSEQLGQSLIVENRTGAGGAIADERVVKSPADGYTLLMIAGASSTVQSALQRGKLSYDLERDLAPVSLVAIGGWVLAVHPALPVRNVKDLIALARAQPGKLNYGSSGVGSATHLAGELFNMMAKVNTVHVPYKGAAESAIAIATGQIEMSFASAAAMLSLIESGRLRLLAVTTAKRASLMPSIPTLSEAGLPGYEYFSWYGVLAPTGVSKSVIAQLHGAIGKAVNTSEVKSVFSKQGLESQTNTPEQFATLIHAEIEKNAKLIKFAGLKAE